MTKEQAGPPSASDFGYHRSGAKRWAAETSDTALKPLTGSVCMRALRPSDVLNLWNASGGFPGLWKLPEAVEQKTRCSSVRGAATAEERVSGLSAVPVVSAALLTSTVPA